jgi:hypothetical protein
VSPGDAVEVNVVWAAGGLLEGPFRDWLGGYEFIRDELATGCVIVKGTRGTFAGVELQYDAADVRPVRPGRGG